MNGLMEFTGVDKAARSKMGVWKMQEWTYRHDMARVDIAGVDKSARYGKGGHCGNGQCGTIVARVDNAGGKKRVQGSLTETVLYYIDFVRP